MEEAWTSQDLIGVLSQFVLDPADFIRCSMVCQVWRSCFLEYKPKSQVVPWLMLAERDDSDVRDFYNVVDGKILSITLPETRGMSFFNTTYGWILTLGLGLDLGIHLLHPLSRIRIPLPNTFIEDDDNKAPADKFWIRRNMVTKVCLSSHPTEINCVVLAICRPCKVLAFTRLGDNHWTNVKYHSGRSFRDILFFKGLFYAIRCDGVVSHCDIDLSQPEAKPFTALPPRTDGNPWDFFSLYLVECGGQLFAVARSVKEIRAGSGKLIEYYTHKFEVFIMEQDAEQGSKVKWCRVMDLGDYAFFVGRSTSTAVCTKDANGIRKNCIYFTDDCWKCFAYSRVKGGKDAGIFSMATSKVEKHYQDESLSLFSPPAWLMFPRLSLQ